MAAETLGGYHNEQEPQQIESWRQKAWYYFYKLRNLGSVGSEYDSWLESVESALKRGEREKVVELTEQLKTLLPVKIKQEKEGKTAEKLEKLARVFLLLGLLNASARRDTEVTIGVKKGEQVTLDMARMYPELEKKLQTSPETVTIEEALALLRFGSDLVLEGDILLDGSDENPEVAKILFEMAVKVEHLFAQGKLTAQYDMQKFSPQVQRFLQDRSVAAYAEDIVDNDLGEVDELLEQDQQLKQIYEKTIRILQMRIDDLSRDLFLNERSTSKQEFWEKACDALKRDMPNIVKAIYAALDIGDADKRLFTQARIFTNPEWIGDMTAKTLAGDHRGESHVEGSKRILEKYVDTKTNNRRFIYSTKKSAVKSKREIRINPASNDTYTDFRHTVIHELLHNIVEGDRGILQAESSPLYAPMSERFAEYFSEKVEFYLSSVPQKEGYEVYYNMHHITPVLEMIEQSIRDVYTEVMSPEEFVQQVPQMLEAWGIAKEDAASLAYTLVKFNSIRNPYTKRVMEEFFKTNPTLWIQRSFDSVPLQVTAENYEVLLTEVATGDIILINDELGIKDLTDERQFKSWKALYDLRSKLMEEYTVITLKFLVKNFTFAQVSDIIETADISHQLHEASRDFMQGIYERPNTTK